MLATPKAKSELFLASSLCDGLEDNNIKQVTTLLLSKEADPNVLIPSYGITPFHLVIGNDSEVFAEEVTKLFLRHGGNPNVTSAEGLTPVHVAAAWGRVGVLELLLANGGDPLRMDDERRTPFHYAFDGKYYKAITVLGRYCADATEKDEGFKYKRRLDKVLVNNGDMLAEYIVSESNASGESCSPRADQCTSRNENSAGGSFRTELEESNRKADQLCRNLKGAVELSDASGKGDARRNFFNSNVTVRKRQSSLVMAKRTTPTVESPTNPTGYADLAQMRIEEDNDREKVLVSEIINYLSTSVLNESSDELSIIRRESSLKVKPREVMSAINPWKNEHGGDGDLPNSKACDHCCAKRTRNVSLIPQLKHKAVERDGDKKTFVSSPKTPVTGKSHPRSATQSATMKKGRRCFSRIPVRLEYSPDDCIVSKSPNLIVPSPLRDSKLRRAFVFDKRTTTPSDGSKNCEECHLTPSKAENHKTSLQMRRGRIAQSTPRRRQSRLCRSTNKKELKSRKNYMLKTTNAAIEKGDDAAENLYTSLESSLLSLSPDFPDSHKIRGTGVHSCAVKLDECKYDEDNDSDEQPSRVLQSGTVKSARPYVFGSRTDSEKDKDDHCGIGVALNESLTTSDNTSSMDGLNNNVRFSASRSKDGFTNAEARDNRMNHAQNLDRRVCLNAKESLDNVEDIPPDNSMTFCVPRVHASAKFFGKHVYNARDSDVPEKDGNASSLRRFSVMSYVSVQEEYEYEDPEEGVKLVERRYCLTPSGTIAGDEDHEFLSAKGSCNSTVLSSCSVPAEAVLLDDRALRTKLTQLGDIPGPITNTTRQIYLKRLVRLAKKAERPVDYTMRKDELRGRISSRLQYGSWVNELITLQQSEKRVFAEFTAPDPSRKWREGTAKTCFNYLLLDSRITEDLPSRVGSLSESDLWTAFVSSIFYIGKGSRSRPYAHLYDAFHVWVTKGRTCPNSKMQHILDIWNGGYGVVCLHVFQNVIPVEAYTREAAMIDAAGLENLKNSKSGEYYGIAATWSMKEKCKFGRYLLYRAMQVLMHEGERQLFPQHL